MQSTNLNNNDNVAGASASARPRSPGSLEAGGADDAAAAGGFVDVRLSVAVPPSPYRSSFSATGGGTATKTVGSAQNSPRVAEGGVRVVFKDLTYTVRSNAKRRLKVDLLKSVSGVLPASSLTALMGPSGSSKTTLLDVLSGRTTAGTLAREGCVTYGGARPTPAFLRHACAYVEQRESLVPNLTVFEMLMYTAELRLPAKTTTLADRRRRVEDVLRRLRLAPCAHVRIGSALDKGVSGGQAKRVNIGVALVGDPRVLFLDEPTTGLDAVHANEVMSTVKALTVGDCGGGEASASDSDDDGDDDEGGGGGRGGGGGERRKRKRRQAPITVCATIHSPTPFAYSLFDSLVLLIGGRVAYCGTTEDAAPIRFFQQALMTRVVVGGGDEGGSSRPFDLPRFDFGVGGAAGAATSGTGEQLSSSASLSRNNNRSNSSNNDRQRRKNLPSLSAPEWLLEAVVAADRREGAGEALAEAFRHSPGAAAVAAAAAEDGCFSSCSPSSSSSGALGGTSRSSSGRLPVVSSPTGAQAAAHGVSSALRGLAARASSFFSRKKKVAASSGGDGGGGDDTNSSSHSLSTLAPCPNSRLSTTLTLLRYRMTRDLVDPSWLGPRSLDKLLLTPIIASLYWRVGAKGFAAGGGGGGEVVDPVEAAAAASNTGALLFLFSILPGYAAASYMPCIVLERPLFVREVADGLYTPASYLAAKMLGESVVYVFVSIAVTAMVWWPCALDQRGGDYLAFWAGNLVTTLSGVALGYAVAALSPSMGVANAALPAYVTMLLFFVGLLLPSRSIPKMWVWLEKVSFLRYAWRAQMINVFGPGSKRPDPSVIEYYSMGDGATAWGQLGIGAGFAAGFVVVAWASLAFVRHQKR